MKKIKIILTSIFILLVTICVTSGGLSVQDKREVYATINDDGSWDFGSGDAPYVYNTQSAIAEYSSETIVPLYVDNDNDKTRLLYTEKLTNLASIDNNYFVDAVYASSFGSTSYIQIGSSTNSSLRLPWLSHAFKISDNLLEAGKNGYLDVSVSVTSQITTSQDYMKSILYNGTLSGKDDITFVDYNMTSINQSTDAVSQTLTLSGVKKSDFLVVFAMNRTESGSRTLKMSITNPTLTIASKDESAPAVTFDCDKLWSANGKLLTITITDDCGILNVSSDNALTFVSQSETDQKRVYTMEIPENGNYSITVEDNVGNSKTYTYTESTIDKSDPTEVNITVPILSYTPNINVSASFTTDHMSPETIYYTLDGSTPTTTSSTLNSGDNALTIPFGEYTFKAVVIDGVGRIGPVTTESIKIDRRSLTISTTKCGYTVTKPTTLDSDTGYQFYDGENIRIDFTADSGCSKKVIRVNGVESTLNTDYYEFVGVGDVDIEVIYVTNLTLIDCIATYTFDPDVDIITPVFTMNTDEELDLDIVITQNDIEVAPKNVGVYTLTWSYYSYEWGGRGSFDFEIVSLDVYIEAEEDQYKIYGDNDPDQYAYIVTGLPASVILDVTLERVEGEDVGSYEINLVATNLDDNYNVIYESQNFAIRAKKVIILADNLEKVYGDNDPILTYQFYETTLIEGDVLNGALTRIEGENVGSYVISKGTLSNANYEILFLNGIFNIVKKDIFIEIDDISTTYGEAKSLSYSTSADVDRSEISGSLERTSGDEIGVYSITIGTLTSHNYNINVTKNGVYSISPKVIDVRALSADKIYGGIDNLQYEVDGLIDGDVLYGALSRNAGESVGRYEINQGSLNNSNYIINFQSAYLDITPAGLIINISSLSQVYGQMDVELEYSVEGLQFDDKITCQLYREAGDDVGEYIIDCMEITDSNYYIAEVNKGVYSITKATIIPIISTQKFIYSGNTHYVSLDFPFEVDIVYKQNGIECDGMINAGTYSVQAIFAGNHNYTESKSSVIDVVVEKQFVYLTLGDNEYIYDGTIKLPEFYYDTTCGLDINKISYKFTNDIMPQEVGSYDFEIVTTDNNYEINASGILTIAKSFSISNINSSIVECEDATFDEGAQGLVLVESKIEGKFGDKEIISSCYFDNVEEDNEHIYTVRIKATDDAENVYVYQLSKDNSVREIVVTSVDGYYVFKVDNITDTYLITKDIEPLPLWFWLAIIGGVAVILIVTLQIIKSVKKKRLIKAESASIDTYNIN